LASDEAEYEARKREEVIGVGETVLGFMLGRRRTSAATTIATRRRMTSKVKLEMEQSKDEITKLRTEITSLEGELRGAIKEITDRWQMSKDEVTFVEVRPVRADIDVRIVTLAWVPYWLIRHREGPVISTVRIPGIAAA
jgi:vacuolar-type H+-ATPase subunit F/Vma7